MDVSKIYNHAYNHILLLSLTVQLRYQIFCTDKLRKFSQNNFKSRDGGNVKIYENALETYPDDYFINYPYENLEKKTKEFLPNITFIFDVGANIGIWTIPKRLSFNQDVKFYCFEPSKIIHEYLTKNLSEYQNTYIYNCALSDKDGYENLSLSLEAIRNGRYFSTGLGSLKFKTFFFNEKVQTFKFDTFFKKSVRVSMRCLKKRRRPSD